MSNFIFWPYSLSRNCQSLEEHKKHKKRSQTSIYIQIFLTVESKEFELRFVFYSQTHKFQFRLRFQVEMLIVFIEGV